MEDDPESQARKGLRSVEENLVQRHVWLDLSNEKLVVTEVED